MGRCVGAAEVARRKRPSLTPRQYIGFGMQFGTIEKRPAFEQYWRRISARPAALRAKESDDTLVAQEQPQSSG